MIYGDPNEIAFQIDPVREWNIEGNYWVNGLFAVFIKGEVFFLPVYNVTLNLIYARYKGLWDNPNPAYVKAREESNNVLNIEEENIRLNDAFRVFYNKIYKEYGFVVGRGFVELTNYILSDNEHYIFAFFDEEKDILCYGRCADGVIVKENVCFLRKGCIRRLIHSVEEGSFNR